METALKKKNKNGFDILDLGCGDGRLLFSLQHLGLLKNAKQIVGVDMSETRVKRLVKNVSNVRGLVSDACEIKELDNQSFDVIVCSQLIEHVPDERALLREMRRLVKRYGFIYISSVVRKPYGFWLYRVDGEFRLDPTHIREYPSKEYFLQLLREEGFYPVKVSSGKVKYPFFELMVRSLIVAGLIHPEGMQTIFLRYRSLERFRHSLKLPVPGYERIEVLASINR